MKVEINWSIAKGTPDMDEMEFLHLKSSKSRNRMASISFKVPDSNNNFHIAAINTGVLESSDVFAAEIAKRWNEYNELKRENERLKVAVSEIRPILN